jgi:hypothetical protein
MIVMCVITRVNSKICHHERSSNPLARNSSDEFSKAIYLKGGKNSRTKTGSTAVGYMKGTCTWFDGILLHAFQVFVSIRENFDIAQGQHEI